MLETIALIVATAIASMMLTAWFLGHALKKGMLDIPNERSSHNAPTPRGGGMAIVVVCSLGLIWLGIVNELPDSIVLALLVTGSLVAGVGWLDDKKGVPPIWRLLVHASSAALLFWALYLTQAELQDADTVYVALLALLIVPGLTWLLNLYNFMDGIDGLAGFEAVSVASTAALLIFWQAPGSGLSLALLLIAAATAGFLWWNWPHARIFMGDGGSGWLGFMLGAIALCSLFSGVLSLWPWLILLGVFIVDASATLARRLLCGEAVFRPHRSHAYQRWSRYFNSHNVVTIITLLINLLWLFPLAVIAVAFPAFGMAWLIVAWAPLFGIWLWSELRLQG